MAQPPKYAVTLADLDKDWECLFSTYWDSWKTPLQAVGQLTLVGIGTTKARSNPAQKWVKIEDPERERRGPDPIIRGGMDVASR
ncbi:hypothetical protein GGR51DRAFT_562780 [Nemania sp. FL0031]|nr:hypothetical protein GGR51DRAFT_562780 [Nemania sp. FL0031]